MQCGEDLASVKPEPDRYEGLRVVLCAVCGRAAVRVHDPVVLRWRKLRVQAGAMVLLAAHAAVLGGLGMAVWFGGMMVSAELMRRGRLSRPEQWVAFAAFGLLVPLVAGFWLGMTMHGKGLIRRAVAWLAVPVVAWLAVIAAELVQALLAVRYDMPRVHLWPRHIGEFNSVIFGLWLGIIIGTVGPMLVGGLVAVFGRFMWRLLVSALFRWRRRRARTLRSGS